jgi:hypothetical protein
VAIIAAGYGQNIAAALDMRQKIEAAFALSYFLLACQSSTGVRFHAFMFRQRIRVIGLSQQRGSMAAEESRTLIRPAPQG